MSPSNPPTPPAPSPAPAGGEPHYAMRFAEQASRFWQKYQGAIYGVCAVILIAIVARGAWDYLAARRERSLGQAYAAAQTPEQLHQFAADHGGDTLSGVAWLRLADQAYAAQDGAEAVKDYQQAAKVLPPGALAQRARLGLAMAQVLAGQGEAGEAGLKQLAGDAAAFQGLRTEALYQLASLAQAAGQTDTVKAYAQQALQIDPASPWTQRAQTLLPAEASQPAGTTATAAAAPVSTPATAAEPAIKFNLPPDGK